MKWPDLRATDNESFLPETNHANLNEAAVKYLSLRFILGKNGKLGFQTITTPFCLNGWRPADQALNGLNGLNGFRPLPVLWL
jgi:hypothetical protein